MVGVERAERPAKRDDALAVIARGISLTSEQERQLRLACRTAERYAPGVQVFGKSKPGTRRLGLILSGWACESCVLLDGRRQIFSVMLPGDFFVACPQQSYGARSLISLTAVEVADISAASRDNQAEGSSFAQALADAELAREQRLFDQIARLGRLSAFERVVHFLLEIRGRLAAAGLATGNTFRLPLTQDVLADTLGLSMVHVNRTLQQLRRQKLIELRNGNLTLLRPHALAVIAGLDDQDDADEATAPSRRSFAGAL